MAIRSSCGARRSAATRQSSIVCSPRRPAPSIGSACVDGRCCTRRRRAVTRRRSRACSRTARMRTRRSPRPAGRHSCPPHIRAMPMSSACSLREAQHDRAEWEWPQRIRPRTRRACAVGNGNAAPRAAAARFAADAAKCRWQQQQQHAGGKRSGGSGRRTEYLHRAAAAAAAAAANAPSAPSPFSCLRIISRRILIPLARRVAAVPP